MTTDEKFMNRAIQLAKLGIGNIAPNPAVGAVIVYENQIIGEGFHQKYGEGHAEVNAVNSVKKQKLALLSESTIYVTLEPCHHYGKTPPCVDLLLKHKFKKVVIGCQDPNPKVGGQSIEKLRQNGVEVEVGVLEKTCFEVAKRFMTFHTKKRPYVILKFAKSKDSFIGKPNEQIWITGSQTKRLVHRWRSEEGAILVGTNTVAIDNPTLTNRLWTGENPVRVVIDANNRLLEDLNVFNADAKTIRVKTTDLSEILSLLHNEKINSVIIEGGAKILQAFINENLWDEARVFTGNKYLQTGIEAPKFDFQTVQLLEKRTIGNDILEIFSNGILKINN